LLELAGSLAKELPGLISDRVQLLALELRRAGQSLAKILVFVLGALILLSTAWIALWVGLTLALIHFGLHWAWAIIVILVLNIGVAVFALLRAKALVHNLTLPATMRRLTVAPPGPPGPPAAAPPAPMSPPASAPVTGAAQS
jgi:hypothetical protein